MDKTENIVNGVTAISLFSGAGGLDVGFEQSGYEIVWANEFDSDAVSAWKANRPGHESVMTEGDIWEHLADLHQFAGQVDVVFGGPPCQGFSVAGKMDANDPRSSLVWAFIDAVEIVKPKVFLIENVKALASLKKFEGVRQGIKSRANELGYDVEYRVYLASDFGVPQKRERVFFIGARKNAGLAKEAHDFMGAFMRPAPTVRDTLNSVGVYGTDENPQTCTAHISLAKNPVMRHSPYAGMLVNGAGRPINLDDVSPTLPASMGGNKTPIVDQAALEDPARENWFAGYHRRLVDGKSAPEDEEVPEYARRLTIVESAAIQTFPTGYIFGGKKTKQYKQIGNAVPCDLAQAVARAIGRAYFAEA